MKLTVLVDNNTYIDEYYQGEPGFSCYLEEGNIKLLFDTGYSDLFMKNAEKMGINVMESNHIVLSHGHNDHTQGLKYMMEKGSIYDKALIAHPECFSERFMDGEPIGCPIPIEQIACNVSFIPCFRPFMISPSLIFLGEIPRTNDFENLSPIGVQRKNNRMLPDYVLDDSALVHVGEDGLFIITGCAHSGICNIMEYVKQIFPDAPITGILGGFHLMEDNAQLEKTIDYLASCNIKTVYPCHCVSLEAKAKMMEKLNVAEVGVGLTLEIESVRD